MSSPKVIVQIAIAGAQILGRAFLAAGRQAMQNAKHRPEGMVDSDVTGMRSATSGSLTDRLSREHRMTLDEARLILNVRKEDSVEKMLQNYQHLFKANALTPPAAGAGAKAAGKKASAQQPAYSHYLQSKVVRARERMEAENKLAAAEGEQPPLADAKHQEASPGSSASESPSSTPQDGGKAP